MSQESLLEATLILADPYAPWTEVTGQNGSGLQLRMRGYARLGDRYLHGDDLCAKVCEICNQQNIDTSLASLKSLIPKLDGGWALVATWPDGRLLAATDRMRTIPLFWTVFQNQLIVADSAPQCAQAAGGREIDEQAALEFVLVGYVTGDQTLFRGVSQIQSGEMLEFNPRAGESIQRDRYYRFYPTEKSTKSEAELERDLVTVLDDVFSTFARSLSGEQIVVPLSGGLDSRLVVGMLKRHHVPNVLCYTFGDPQGTEARISRQVAEVIGYEWTCAEYDRNTWKNSCIDNTLWDYWNYGSKGCSRPCAMDLPAMHLLIETGRITPSNAIVFPGHSGDMVAGSHIPVNYQALERSPKHLTQKIWNKHFRIWPVGSPLGRPEFTDILQKIERVSAKPASSLIDSPCARSEMWDTECRQAVYIVNSVRCYEFSGMRWRTLWDYPLMDFFLTVPNELRFGERLYVNAIRDHLFVGDQQVLADIPLAGHGTWTSRNGFKTESSAPRRIAGALVGMARTGWRRAWGQTASACSSEKAADVGQLAAIGVTDPNATFRDSLEFRDTIDHLPPAVHRFLEPFFENKVTEISWWAMTLPFVLAHMVQTSDTDCGYRQEGTFRGKTIPTK